MKADIHPNYTDTNVHCACGNEFVTRSTMPRIDVEVCSACHPFFTGTQKIMDTEGRVERFKKRYAKQ
ncbi:MAG: 50S ribosomal protein L31 [Nitrospirae bacterium]|nr:50S ribosomal protein L31 [Nitrospirota bacterium]